MRRHFTAKHQRYIGNICVDHKAFTVSGGQKTGEELGGRGRGFQLDVPGIFSNLKWSIS